MFNLMSEYYRKKNVPLEYFDRLEVDKPLLTKEQLNKDYTSIFSDDVSAVSFNRLIPISSSGSTGTPITVYWDPNDLIRSNLTLWRLRKQYYNITPDLKQIAFETRVTDNVSVDSAIRMMDKNYMLINKFLINDDTLSYLYKKIFKFNPDWMFIQPNLAIRIFDFIKKNQLVPIKNLKYIELNGEVLHPSIKQQIKNLTNVTVANMYGCNEINSIAYECPCGKMHVVKDNVHVQLFNARMFDNQYIGQVVISSKQNKSFPILGYSLNDRISMVPNDECDCGFSGQTITKIWGRESSNIIINNKNIDLRLVEGCIDHINLELGLPIIQFKIQYDLERIFIKITLKKDFANWQNAIINELQLCCSEQLQLNKSNLIITVDDSILNVSGKLLHESII